VKTVLLIDDDDRLRLSFAEALRVHGYHVLEASSGPAGLEIARRQMPDVILSDVHMPGGGGQDLLREIRNDPELSSRQVVLMTGSAGSVTLRKGMELGADDFLLKPVDLERLLRCVEARLARAQTNWRVEDKMLRRLRSSLHSTLPHEFFTPLAGILGLATILRSDFKILSPDEVREIHDDIYFSGMRLHRTLRNYLEILDLEAAPPGYPSSSTPLRPVALREAIGKGIQLVAERTKRAHDITLQVEDCTILAQSGDVSLMAEELVDNGCRFSRPGSPVKVEMNAEGVLTVTDAGRGILPEEIEKIGAFQQFDRKTLERQGLGLGLILVKKLAAKSGATFAIESPGTEAGGARVRLAFRLAEVR
jgi:two-component system sensor histidine kinase/response regulator